MTPFILIRMPEWDGQPSGLLARLEFTLTGT